MVLCGEGICSPLQLARSSARLIVRTLLGLGSMARLTIVSDAWTPQVNGVVTTLSNTVDCLRKSGHAVTVIAPDGFKTWPCPTYPEIRLAHAMPRDVGRLISASAPDYVLIAVEGPLGLAARLHLAAEGIPFSSAVLTRFHDYLWQRFGLPRSITLRGLRWFHKPAARTFTPSASMTRLLHSCGLTRAETWRPGVDRSIFKPTSGPASELVEGLQRPVQLYIGRLAVEKNVEAFLGLGTGGSKVVVGDGPMRKRLERQYPAARFLGYRRPFEIAEICTAADVLVFPSRTDTFGHVMVEALACGLPVAAFPVDGPKDVLIDPSVAAMDLDLSAAVSRALKADREACTEFAKKHFCWERSVEELLRRLAPASPLSTLREIAIAGNEQTSASPGLKCAG